MNVAEGLELQEGVLSPEEQAQLVATVEHWVALVGWVGGIESSAVCMVVGGWVGGRGEWSEKRGMGWETEGLDGGEAGCWAGLT